MSGRRHNTFEEKPSSRLPLIEHREPEVYHSTSQRRRTIIYKTTTVRSRHKEQRERSPSPRRSQRRVRTPSPPPRRYREDKYMSQDTSNLESNFVPLPQELPTMDSKTKKSSKDKPKVYNKSHKRSDTGYGSGYDTAEYRSPEQYSTRPPTPKSKADVAKYETIDGKPLKGIYIAKDGRTVKYISSTPSSPRDKDYVPASAIKSADTYKLKYKEAKVAGRELQKVVDEVADTARINYEYAREGEAAFAKVQKLEEQLRELKIDHAYYKSKAVESDQKRLEAEQKIEKRELEDQLAARQDEYIRREKRLEREQWAEIEATESPLSPRLSKSKYGPPLLVTQLDKRPGILKSTGLTNSSYKQTLVSKPTKPSTDTASTNPFMDAVLEARRDYDKKTQSQSQGQGQDQEDRQHASDIRYGGTKRSSRPRSESFYK